MMFKKIGIVSWWFNRGQATVGRYLRSIFSNLGHETFVLARPNRPTGERPNFIAETDIWAQKDITTASHFQIPFAEYENWVNNNKIEIVFFDQNYQFEEIRKLKEKTGVKTIGRFVWESFSTEHIKPAISAFNIIYSLTHCESKRYRKVGIKSPYIRWGCHPELLLRDLPQKREKITYFYPGGYLTPRKPTRSVIEAFTQASSPDVKLIIKIQTNRANSIQQHIGEIKALDKRISVISKDLNVSEYYDLFSSCHVCLSPSHWEGLGLHLYEATAFGMPIITNDNPPMNEIVKHNDNGLLIGSHPVGFTKSRLHSYAPNIGELKEAIDQLSDLEALRNYYKNTQYHKSILNWNNTIDGFDKLLQTI